MNILILTFMFLLGTIIGSFLNVVIYRFNTGRTPMDGRSICMSCSRNLYWYELIPILSFLFQKGRCRSCHTKISSQYPIVEFVTGFVFVLLAWRFMPLLGFSLKAFEVTLVYFMVIFSTMIVISVYDIRHKIIPDKLIIFLSLIVLLSMFINMSGVGHVLYIPSMERLYAGPLLALPFALIWLFSRGTLMGLGDAKLILVIGWMLGLSSGTASLIISFWIGAVFGIVMMVFGRMNIKMKTEIPFAPFLILGAFLVIMFNINLLDIIQLFTFV
jgi:prepilin signal peptidase PulO-like enzyme (type II secretory pathway)